jgi:hypothetical protein
LRAIPQGNISHRKKFKIVCKGNAKNEGVNSVPLGLANIFQSGVEARPLQPVCMIPFQTILGLESMAVSVKSASKQKAFPEQGNGNKVDEAPFYSNLY